MKWLLWPVLLAGCANAEGPSFIGTATMSADQSINLKLVSRECDGTIVHGSPTYALTDPLYGEILEHIGGLEPGQTKPVPAWESPPC